VEKKFGGDRCAGRKKQTEGINEVNRMKLELKKVDEGDTALVLVSITTLIIAIFALIWERM
jgi:hypothetical protein